MKDVGQALGFVGGTLAGSWLFRYFQYVAFGYPTYRDLNLLIGLTLFLAVGGLFIRPQLPNGWRRFVVTGVVMGVAALLIYIIRGKVAYGVPVFSREAPVAYAMIFVNWFVVGMFGPAGELAGAQLLREHADKPLY